MGICGGNQNVWSATRYNANWVDLNRNYPDHEDGPHQMEISISLRQLYFGVS